MSNISIADHLAIIAVIDISPSVNTTKQSFEYREMKEKNWLGFKRDLINIEIIDNSIELKWSKLLDDIKMIVDKNFPKRKSKHLHTFVMSRGLLKSRDKKTCC